MYACLFGHLAVPRVGRSSRVAMAAVRDGAQNLLHLSRRLTARQVCEQTSILPGGVKFQIRRVWVRHRAGEQISTRSTWLAIPRRFGENKKVLDGGIRGPKDVSAGKPTANRSAHIRKQTNSPTESAFSINARVVAVKTLQLVVPLRLACYCTPLIGAQLRSLVRVVTAGVVVVDFGSLSYRLPCRQNRQEFLSYRVAEMAFTATGNLQVAGSTEGSSVRIPPSLSATVFSIS
jgi:hypothetical protein